jgi:CheY-like chemotaxis protein
MLNLGDDRLLPTVLLIDDDFVSREVMATMLTMAGYPVHTAAAGGSALALLAGGACVPEVILMDAQMPGLSGAALIEELRARSRATIIAVSASNPPAEAVAAADGFLLKPFAVEALDKLLKDRETQAARAAASIPNPEEPVVSPETLAQLREMMPEPAVRQIYAAVIADLDRRLEALQVAIANNDAAEARRIGHSIKGGCGMAGALQAARLGAAIESGALETGTNAAGNHLDNSSSILQDLRAASHNLQRMLDAEFPRGEQGPVVGG